MTHCLTVLGGFTAAPLPAIPFPPKPWHVLYIACIVSLHWVIVLPPLCLSVSGTPKLVLVF